MHLILYISNTYGMCYYNFSCLQGTGLIEEVDLFDRNSIKDTDLISFKSNQDLIFFIPNGMILYSYQTKEMERNGGFLIMK